MFRPRTLLAFGAGPVLFFGIPFVATGLYAMFDSGLLMYSFYAWAHLLFTTTSASGLAVVLFLGLSSALAVHVLSKE